MLEITRASAPAVPIAEFFRFVQRQSMISKCLRTSVWIALLSVPAFAQSKTVVFHESGFPTADSAPATDSALHAALPDAQFASANQLKERLPSAQLLVLPYGSAFPEES